MHTDSCASLLFPFQSPCLHQPIPTDKAACILRLPPSTAPTPDPLFESRLRLAASPHDRRSCQFHPLRIPCRPVHTCWRPRSQPGLQPDLSHAKKFTTGVYHGTVVWIWNSLVMLGKGLEVQLSAMATAEQAGTKPVTADSACARLYTSVRTKMKRAYGKFWDTIEASKEHSMAEMWSWR